MNQTKNSNSIKINNNNNNKDLIDFITPPIIPTPNLIPPPFDPFNLAFNLEQPPKLQSSYNNPFQPNVVTAMISSQLEDNDIYVRVYDGYSNKYKYISLNHEYGQLSLEQAQQACTNCMKVMNKLRMRGIRSPYDDCF